MHALLIISSYPIIYIYMDGYAPIVTISITPSYGCVVINILRDALVYAAVHSSSRWAVAVVDTYRLCH